MYFLTAATMRVPIATIAYGLLSMTTSTSGQDLDLIINMCVRFDHQIKLATRVSKAADKMLTTHSGPQEWHTLHRWRQTDVSRC